VILQTPEPDPAELTEQVRRVMSREEFQYPMGPIDRLTEWINEQLERLFGGAEPTTSTAPNLGGLGSVIAWLLIVVAVVAVVAVVVYVVRHQVRRRRPADPDLEVEIEHRRSAREWASDAERLEAAGDWKGALRAHYRHLVRTLVDRGQLPDIAGRTTGELREDLERTTPAAADAFDTASLRFELAWYADLAADEEQVAELRAAAERVLAAPHDRLDAPPASSTTVEVSA
jgi:hypothetical protein